jgi:glyoxylase I family protein
MPVERLEHVGMTVLDIDRTIAFYCDVLGCKVLSRDEPPTDPGVRRLVGVPDADIRGAILEMPGGELIELVMYLRPAEPPRLVDTTTPSAVHLALRVSELDELMLRLRQAGATPVSDPVKLGNGRIVYCRDPFGVLLELVEVPRVDA